MVLMVVVAVALGRIRRDVGVFFFSPAFAAERMAHKTHKVQARDRLRIVPLFAVQHMHIFWILSRDCSSLHDLPISGSPASAGLRGRSRKWRVSADKSAAAPVEAAERRPDPRRPAETMAAAAGAKKRWVERAESCLRCCFAPW